MNFWTFTSISSIDSPNRRGQTLVKPPLLSPGAEKKNRGSVQPYRTKRDFPARVGRALSEEQFPPAEG
jgi:hypothetical protein